MNKKDFKMQSLGDNWFSCAVDGRYFINAKIYDEPSESGIDNGRISKLFITHADRYVVCNYDRGWDVKPSKAADLALFHEFLNCFN